MAINKRISDKIRELEPENKFLRSKLISILNRAEEGRQVTREIKRIIQDINAD